MEAKIILVSLFTLSRSFVLDSMVTELPSVLAAHDYKQLVDLILDEKHSRSQLEQQVQDLRLQLAAQNVAMQQQNNRTKADLELQNNRTKADLELQNNRMKADFELQSNRTKMDLEVIQHDLDKEKSNRHQLARAYTRLTMEYHNLSLDHTALLEHNKDLGMQVRNLSVDRDTLANATIDLETRFHNLNMKHEAMTQKNAHLETQVHNMSMNQAALSRQNTELQIQVHNSSLKTRADIATNKVDLLTNHADLLELKQKQGYKSGFTAQRPKDGPRIKTITFQTIISNIGNNYNPVSGQFTCSYPGMYYFSLSIYQSKSSHFVYCWIEKNGSVVIGSSADTRSITDNAYFQASNSVFLHLSRGDTVGVGSCNAGSLKNISNAMDQLTSFTGFLIGSD